MTKVHCFCTFLQYTNMRIFLLSLRHAGAFLLHEVCPAISTQKTIEVDAENTKSCSKCDKTLMKTRKDHDETKMKSHNKTQT